MDACFLDHLWLWNVLVLENTQILALSEKKKLNLFCIVISKGNSIQQYLMNQIPAAVIQKKRKKPQSKKKSNNKKGKSQNKTSTGVYGVFLWVNFVIFALSTVMEADHWMYLNNVRDVWWLKWFCTLPWPKFFDWEFMTQKKAPKQTPACSTAKALPSEAGRNWHCRQTLAQVLGSSIAPIPHQLSQEDFSKTGFSVPF